MNPDTIRAQMEGSIVYGLSAALYGEITIKAGRVQQRNFNDAKVMRINEMPAVEVASSKALHHMAESGSPERLRSRRRW